MVGFMKNFRVRTAAVISAAFALTACDYKDLNEGYIEPAFVAGPTAQGLALRSVPLPADRIEVSVFDFPDLTGQYNERENVQSLSRAVTQGGSAMLIKALQDAGNRRWFTVLDRAGLQDLLRERQIITEMRRQYRGEDTVNPNALAPLRHSGIILQGGIIGYDFNTETGGFGARYLGIGAFTQWNMDTITVNLRAVSTESGEVLASVTTQKSIVSTSVQGNVFRYVALDELLEGEAGVTANEPKLVATQQAIEKAVLGLIEDGLQTGIWSLADSSKAAALIRQFRDEEYRGLYRPDSHLNLPRPKTRSPAAITQTTPRSVSQRVVQRRVAPAPAVVRRAAPPQAAPKPPASDGETLG